MRRDGRIEIATAAAVLHIAVDYLRADVRSDFVWLDVAELENDAFYQLVFLEIQLTVVVDEFSFVFGYAPRQKKSDQPIKSHPLDKLSGYGKLATSH